MISHYSEPRADPESGPVFGALFGFFCAKRLFPPWMPQIGLFVVRSLFVRKVITFCGREMKVLTGLSSSGETQGWNFSF